MSASVPDIEGEPARNQGPVARARQHPVLLVGIALFTVIALAALLAPVLAPHDPYAQDFTQRRVPPVWYAWLYGSPKASWLHPLGADNLGRDYLSRLLYGTRLSLLIGLAVMTASGLIGSTLGIAAGYFGGRVDLAVNLLLTTRLSIPLVLVALAVVSLFGGSIGIIVAVLGLLLWDRFAVVLRSVTMQVSRQDFVAAARVIGCSTPYILLREILPNILAPLIVVATVEMALAVLLEAALSFLGLGVQPPEPSLGLMLAEGKNDMFFDAWMITIPGVVLFVLVLAINLIGDGIRDLMALDRTT